MHEEGIYTELVYYRKKVKKMSVKEIIKHTGISTSTYLRCEKGERELTLQEASMIAENLSVPMSVLFPKIFTPCVDKNATND